MRLWHIDLIPYLPKTQLISQWRELNSVFKKQNKHILINYVYEHNKYYLKYYSNLVIEELKNRDYNINLTNYYSYFDSLPVDFHNDYTPTYPEHNKEYLTICYYNLKEKYLRGQKDFNCSIWNKLDEFYKLKTGGLMY